MPNYQAQIHTRFGQLLINFDTADELTQRLQDLDVGALTRAVETHLAGVIVSVPRDVKPALEDICRFTSQGRLEFLKPPKERIDAIGIVLYAFDPDPMEIRVIEDVSGVKDPGRYLTNKAYKQYFDAVGRGVYRLSHEGKLWVANEIIPSLIGQRAEEG